MMKKQVHPPDNCMICDLHIVQDILSGLDISEYKKYIILKIFFTHFNQVFNSLLDCKRFRNKFACKLLRDLVY